MFSNKISKLGQSSPLLQVFTYSLLLHTVFVGKLVSREGKVQLCDEPYTFLLIYYGFCFEQNWCEFFADWNADYEFLE